MNHLDDFTLNEYLDHALDDSERDAADLHLKVCADCRAKLDELQEVFAEIDACPEVHLEHDLTPSIMARLPQKEPVRVWTRTFAAQVGVAIGLMFWLGMQAVPFVRVPQFALPKIPSVDVQALFARLLALQLPNPDLRFTIYDFELSTISDQLPVFDLQFPTLNIQPSTLHLTVLSISVLLLWVVGNVILLRSRQGVR